MNEKTPECCQRCKHLDKKGACYIYSGCASWLKWFRAEWRAFRAEAERIKENRKKEVPK